MITEHDKKIVSDIRDNIEKQVLIDGTKVDWEKSDWIHTLYRMANNLVLAPLSYRPCPPEDVSEGFYTAECTSCGWWGSSRLLDGGSAIADTGDYSDCTCPVCGNGDISERD